MKPLLYITLLGLAFSANAQKGTITVRKHQERAVICGTAKGTVPRDSLLIAKAIEIQHNNRELTITSYEISYSTNGRQIKRKVNSGALTGPVKKSILEVVPDNKLFFYNITAKAPDGANVMLNNMEITVW